MFNLLNFLGLVPMVGYGAIDTLLVGISQRVSSILIVLLQNTFTLLLFLFAFLVFGGDMVFSYHIITALLCGTFLSLGFIAFINGLSKGKAGIVTVIANTYILGAALLGIVFLGEVVTIERLLGFVLIVGGLNIIGFNFKDWKNSHLLSRESGMISALLALLFWSFGFFFQKVSSTELPVMQVGLLIEIGAIGCPLLLFLIKKHSFTEYKEIAKSDIFLICTIATFFFAINIVTIKAFQFVDLGIMTAIAGCSPIVTSVLSYYFFKQVLTKQEMVGMLVTVCGIVSLALFA